MTFSKILTMLALLYKEIWTIQTSAWMVWTGAEVVYRSKIYNACFAVRNLDKTNISLDGVDTTTGLGTALKADLIHSGLIKIWYITSKPKLAELEVEVKLYIVIIIIIRYINLYTEPGIEATACARELLYVYVYVYVGKPRCVLASKRSYHLKRKLALLSFVIVMRTCFCFHTWAVHMQTHLPCCVYAESSMEFQCFEVKPEADSPHDDKPSTGMFAVYDAALSALSALTSCCGSVVSCGSATESPCKLPISPIKVTDDVREGIWPKLLSYSMKISLIMLYIQHFGQRTVH